MSLADDTVASGELPPVEGLQQRADAIILSVNNAYRLIDADGQPMVQYKGVIMTLLRFRERTQGLHAYCYEQMSDGSVLAMWANAPNQLQLKAFPDLKTATLWSPRNERNT